MIVVEIWEDVVCPWCYIGERRFEVGLERFPHRDDVRVVRRSLELDPFAPSKGGLTVIKMLSDKYGLSAEEAARAERRVAELADVEGLTIRPERFVANTRDAHRLLHFASERGLQAPLARRLFASYFSEGRDISDHDALARIAGEAEIKEDDARRVLASGAYAAQVEADEREARELGVNGVPFFVIDRRYGISGAQSSAVLLQALERAWVERTSAPAADVPFGQAHRP
jgi:predicted DsbA family dithiol-disulfide isomerase